MSENLAEFDQLYRDNYLKVYRLALGLTHSPSDAEDITQEAFIRAFRSYHTFRKESSFFTWIYRITVNVAHDYIKVRTKLPVYQIAEELGCSVEELLYDPNPDDGPETKLLVNEMIRSCMIIFTECLSVNQRKVFLLVVGLGLPYKQAAEILDCSVGLVKTTLYRARKRLLGIMESRCHLIKKSNTCRCEQMVKLAISQKLTTKTVVNPLPEVNIPDKLNIYMRDMRDIYYNIYSVEDHEIVAKIIKSGLAKKKWATFS